MERALWRLNVLEYVILGFALLLALGGGALVAWILEGSFGVSFRLSWVIVSLFLFVVPGVMVFGRERSAKKRSDDTENREEEGEVDVER